MPPSTLYEQPERDVVALHRSAPRDRKALFRRLQDAFGELAPVEIADGVRVWLPLTWDLNRRVLHDAQVWSRDSRNWADMANGRIPPTSGLYAQYQPRDHMLSVDDPERHKRWSTAMTAALRSYPSMNSLISDSSDLLLNQVCQTGHADLVADYAAPLPILVLGRMFGLPWSQATLLCRLIQQVWAGTDESAAAYQQAQQLLADVVATSHTRPEFGSITSVLIEHGLSDTEARDHLALLVAAGADPATALIGNTLLKFLTDADTRSALLRAEITADQVATSAVHEYPPVQLLVGRYALADLRIGRYLVRRGDCVLIGFGLAHLDLMRNTRSSTALYTNRAHLTWGAGMHHCPVAGQDIAQTLAESALVSVVDRLPKVTLAVDPDRLRWNPAIDINRLLGLPVKFSPSAPRSVAQDARPRPSAPPSAPPRRTPSVRAWLTGLWR